MPDGLSGEEQAIYFSKVRKFFDSYACSRVMGRRKKMSDYIRKADAIDDLHTQLMYRMGSDDMKRRLDDWVKTLPSADVVHVRHGKWKKIGAWGRVYRCNQCGNFLDFDGVNAGRGAANFCPNCMAKMDGKKEG